MKKIFTTVIMAISATYYSQGAGVDSKLKDFMSKAKQNRVAIIGIGDSNQKFGGHGWNKYMSVAITSEFGAYGTGLIQVSNRVPSWSKAKGSTNKGAPGKLAENLFSYWYLPAGEKQKANWNITGYGIPQSMPLNTKAKLNFRLKYGIFKEGNGSFRPAVRKNQPPWTIFFKASSPVLTGGEKNEMKEFNMAVKADPKRDYPIMFSISPVNAIIKGPFLGEFMSIENVNKTSGCSYQTLYEGPGHSLHKMLTNLRKEGDVKIASFMKFVRDGLNGNKSCVVIINSGLNDRNCSIKSLGPESKYPTNSKEGYKDNLKGMISLLERSWSKAGGSNKTIHFALMPSHPVSTPDDKKLISFRKAARELAAKFDNVSFISIPELVLQTTMASQGYYDKHGNAHLTRKGYMEISKAVASAMADTK